MDRIFISVLIVSGNREEFVANAIESVVNQDLEKDNYEIILVKQFINRELDGTFCSKGVKIVQVESENFGHQYSVGIANSRGNVISFLDDDDAFLPHKLRTVKEVFESQENVGYYHNERITRNLKGEPVKYYPILEESFKVRNIQKNIKTMRKLHKNESYFNLSCVSIRREILSKTFDFECMYGHSDDFLFYLAFESSFDMMFDSYKGTCYLFREMQGAYSTLEKYKTFAIGDITRKLRTSAYIFNVSQNQIVKMASKGDMLSGMVFKSLLESNTTLRLLSKLLKSMISSRIRVKGRIFLLFASFLSILTAGKVGPMILRFWFRSERSKSKMKSS